MGFRVPVAHFMQSLAAPQTAALLDSDRFADRGLMRPVYVRQLLSEHASGQQDHGTRLWSLVCLEMWFRTYIDRDGSDVLPESENPYAEFADGVGSAAKLSGASRTRTARVPARRKAGVI